MHVRDNGCVVQGALLKGDRRALGPGADLKVFDIDNANGHHALDRVYTDITGLTQPMPGVVPPVTTDGAPPPMPPSARHARAFLLLARRAFHACSALLPTDMNSPM